MDLHDSWEYKPTSPAISVPQTSDLPVDFVTAGVFPNPASDYVVVSVNSDVLQKIELYNMNSRLVKEYTRLNDDRVTMNLSGLPAGIYVIRIIGKTHVEQRKIILK